MPAIIVIPARYDSTRFPGKPTALLKGKPVIQHVYENAKDSRLAEDVIVATDSEAVFEKVLSFGGKAMMTSGEHASGTDRVAEVAGKSDCDIIVNVQGDEPLIKAEMIDAVITLLTADSSADIGTLVKRIDMPEDVVNPNVVKTVFNHENFALYFSRAPIPYHRDSNESQVTSDKLKEKDKNSLLDTNNSSLAARYYYKHIGIYSYRRDALLKLTGIKPSRLEEIEKLEQLRALENGFKIKVAETSFETIGVDTPKDLERVEKWLSLSS